VDDLPLDILYFFVFIVGEGWNTERCRKLNKRGLINAYIKTGKGNPCDYILKIIKTEGDDQKRKLLSEVTLMKKAGELDISISLHVVTYYYDATFSDETLIWFILMGKAGGEELRKSRGFSVAAGAQLADKIHKMHVNGILHGDLHTGNIMYNKEVKTSSGGGGAGSNPPLIDIIDFGNSIYTEQEDIMTLETLKFIFNDLTEAWEQQPGGPIDWRVLIAPTSGLLIRGGYREATSKLLKQLTTKAKAQDEVGWGDEEHTWLKQWFVISESFDFNTEEIIAQMVREGRDGGHITDFKQKVTMAWDEWREHLVPIASEEGGAREEHGLIEEILEDRVGSGDVP